MAKRTRRDLYPEQTSLTPIKYDDGKGGTIMVLPSPIIKRDLTDYAYAKDIDEKVITLAIGLAEKLAVTMVRETLALNMDTLVDRISDQLTTKLIEKMPTQQVIIQQTSDTYVPEIKKKVKDFEFDTTVGPINHSSGMVMKGQGTKNTKTNDNIDDTLDALDKLNL